MAFGTLQEFLCVTVLQEFLCVTVSVVSVCDKISKNHFLEINFWRISKNVRLDPKTYLDSQSRWLRDSHKQKLSS